MNREIQGSKGKHLEKLPEDGNLFEVPPVLLHYVVQHTQP